MYGILTILYKIYQITIKIIILYMPLLINIALFLECVKKIVFPLNYKVKKRFLSALLIS